MYVVPFSAGHSTLTPPGLRIVVRANVGIEHVKLDVDIYDAAV